MITIVDTTSRKSTGDQWTVEVARVSRKRRMLGDLLWSKVHLTINDDSHSDMIVKVAYYKDSKRLQELTNNSAVNKCDSQGMVA